MKTKILLIVFFALCNFKSFSQAYHPLIEPNKYWQVFTLDYTQVCDINAGSEYFFNGDTIFNGITYNKLYYHVIFNTNGNPEFCPPFAIDTASYLFNTFMREDSITKKVYVTNGITSEWLLYDFSLIAGDTIQGTATQMCGYLTVDSVRSITINSGSVRKIFYLNQFEFYIEGIGGLDGLFRGYSFCWPNNDYITCVMQNNSHLFTQQIGGVINGCLGTVGLHELSNEQNLSVKFNNDNDFLSIASEIDHLQLIVYDTNGKNCYQSKITKGENSFSLSNFIAGCYLVKVFNTKEQKVKVISIN